MGKLWQCWYGNPLLSMFSRIWMYSAALMFVHQCFVFFLNQIKRLNFCQTVVSGSPPQVAQHAWCGKFFFNYTKCNHNGIYVPRWTDDLVLVTQMCKPLHCEATHLWPASRSAQCKSLFLPYTSPPLWMWIDIYTIFTSFTLDIHVVRLSEE